MARTDAANAANTTYGNQSKLAYNDAQTDIGQYEGDVGKLDAGVNVGANPFQSTVYLSNVNKLQSESLNNAAGSAKSEIARRERATGGLNGSQATMAQRDVGLQTGRLGDTLSAERASSDFGKNLQWQQYLAQSPLSAAQAEEGLYGTATSGQANALTNLSNLNSLSNNFWGQYVLNAQKAAAASGGGAAG